MKRIIQPLFFLLFLVVFVANSQKTQQQIDSITALLRDVKNDSLFVKYHMELGILLDTSNPPVATKHFTDALQKLQRDYSFSDKSEKIALAYDCLGIIERRRNKYDKALDFYLKGLKVKEDAKDSLNIGRSYHNIAMLFASKKEYNKAISYMEFALPLRKNDSTEYGISLRNYGNFFYLKKEYDKATTNLDKATLFLKNDPIRLADVNTIYARIHKSKKEYYKAIEILEKNLEIYTKYEKLERKATTLKGIASIYRKLQNYQKALARLNKAEDIAKIYDNKKLIYGIYLDRFKIFNVQKDYKKALDNYRIYRRYRDSVFTLKQSEKITALELDFQQRKKLEIDRLNYEANEKYLLTITKSQRVQMQLYISLLALTILILVASFFVYRIRRNNFIQSIKKQELETELLNERLTFLQFKTDRLMADHKMREDFKGELLTKIKTLKNQTETKELINEYKSVIVQLENQVKTEKRLDGITAKTDIKDDNGFELKLAQQYPELTKSEREMCHLIYLNLSTKEIMNIRNVTIASVKSARYRIRKKLDIPKGTEMELFIQNLFK